MRYQSKELFLEKCHLKAHTLCVACQKADFDTLQGVANRDLKLENLLLTYKDGWSRPLLKICDFGYSKVSADVLQSCMLVEPRG